MRRDTESMRLRDEQIVTILCGRFWETAYVQVSMKVGSQNKQKSHFYFGFLFDRKLEEI